MTETRSIFSLALLVFAGWLVYLLAPVLTPFLFAGLLAYVCNPMVTGLTRIHLPRPLAVILVFLLFAALLAAIPFFLIPAVQSQIAAFAAKAPAYLDWLQHTALPQAEAILGVDLAPDMEAIRQTFLDHWREVGNWVGALTTYVAQSGLSLLGWFVNLLLIPVVTFYLLLDWKSILTRAKGLFPPRWQGRVQRLAQETDEVLGSFLRGQLSVMAALTVIYSVGLSLVGLDLALPIGLLAGLVSFVPYLGFITGVLTAGVAVYLQFHDAFHLLAVLAVFLSGQLLEGLWLTPRLVGHRIGLHPVAVIFAIMAGGQLFGFLGVLLALPSAAVLKVWLRHVHETYVRGSTDAPRKKRRVITRETP